MDAQIKLRQEECALGMGQSAMHAAVKDAQIESSEEAFAKGTVQRPNCAALKDAETLS